ncbi:MAG: rRNA maturation RNase YbeY [Rubrobacteridae bacterium]|nr:rRNA maturation RNase YbeY [Rubrobacteridae bacterium]
MNILISNDQSEIDLDERFINRLHEIAELALKHEQAGNNVELSIALVDEIEIRELNSRYRGKDTPTDVLSFEVDSEMLGDVIICPSIAAGQAVKYKQSLEQEMALLLVHGILHLLGYDHIDDDEAEIMEAKEREILAEAIPNGGSNGIG